MARFIVLAAVALLAGGSSSVFAQESQRQESQRLDPALDAQQAQHARTQGAVAAQRQEHQEMQADTSALQAQRATCRHESGAAERACEARVQQDKGQKREDIAAFRAAKETHQDDAAVLKADQQRTKALRRD